MVTKNIQKCSDQGAIMEFFDVDTKLPGVTQTQAAIKFIKFVKAGLLHIFSQFDAQ